MKFLLKYILFLHCSFLMAQVPVKFNYSYTMNNCNSRSMCVYRYDNKYFVFGHSTNTLTGQQNGLNLLITDTFGLEVQQKQFYHPGNYLFYANSIRPFQLLHDKYVMFSGHLSLAYQHNNGVLVKFNLSTKDTMWVKSYNQPGDSCEFFTSTFLADSSILVVGERYYLSNGVGYNKPFIMKTDKNGNYKWHKYLYNIWNSYSMLPHKIVKINENSFVIGGNKISNTQNGFILKTDTNANLIFDVGLIGLSKGILMDLILLNDGSGLGIGANYIYQDYVKKLVYQFNINTGVKIKSASYNIESKANGSLCGIQKDNGIIFIGGGTGPGPQLPLTTPIPDVLRLNNNLDSISTYFFPLPTNSQLAPYHIINTNDGGFLTTLFHIPQPGTPKNWLIKADSTGCFEVNCPVNNGIEEAEKENGELMVWPNPATNHFNIRKFSRLNLSKINVSIVNYLGEVILKETIEDSVSEIQISCEQMKSGIYLIRLNSEKAFFETKLIINK